MSFVKRQDLTLLTLHEIFIMTLRGM